MTWQLQSGQCVVILTLRDSDLAATKWSISSMTARRPHTITWGVLTLWGLQSMTAAQLISATKPWVPESATALHNGPAPATQGMVDTQSPVTHTTTTSSSYTSTVLGNKAFRDIILHLFTATHKYTILYQIHYFRKHRLCNAIYHLISLL